MKWQNRITLTLLLATFIQFAIAQQAVPYTSAVEIQFNKIENDILAAAEAMPESKYYFSPDSLHIAGSDSRA